MVKQRLKPSRTETIQSHLEGLKLEKPLAHYWLERYRFNRKGLGLDESKARQYADKTVIAFKKIDLQPTRKSA